MKSILAAVSVAASLLMTSSPTNTVIIVGLNGALQKRFVMDHVLIPGNVHRALHIQTGVGGKGQDVAMAMHCLSSSTSSKSQLHLAQFVGTGPAGDAVYERLQEFLLDATTLSVRVASPMRTCTSIVASDGTTTELVEPSGVIQDTELAQLLQAVVQQKTTNGVAAGLCIMGSMPPGCGDDTYAQIYQRAAGPDTLCVVDSVAGIDALFQQAKLTSSGRSTTIFKVNASELCKLVGVAKASNEAGGVALEELTQAISAFLTKHQGPTTAGGGSFLKGIAITDGIHPAYFASTLPSDSDGTPSFSLFLIHVPSLSSNQQQLEEQEQASTPPTLLYPIGAGDAVAAGTLAAWLYLTRPEQQQQQQQQQHADFVVDAECRNLLDAAFCQTAEVVNDKDDDVTTRQALTAFQFGIACGCLQEENSVLETADVVRLVPQAKLERVVPPSA